MMHAALDRLEEIFGSPKFFDIVKMQRGSKWLGSLLPMEDSEIYGYVTTSSIKILVLIQRESVIPLSKRKDANIHALCVSLVMMRFGIRIGRMFTSHIRFGLYRRMCTRHTLDTQ